jgi:hypothetical protein
MTIKIVDLPIKNGGSFHSYVSLPEGTRIWQDNSGDNSGDMDFFHKQY